MHRAQYFAENIMEDVVPAWPVSMKLFVLFSINQVQMNSLKSKGRGRG